MTVRLPAPGPIAGGQCLEPPLGLMVTGGGHVCADLRWVDDWLHRSYTEFWASLP